MQFFLPRQWGNLEIPAKMHLFSGKMRNLANLREKACIFAGFSSKSSVPGEKNCTFAVFFLFITD